jgi:hypothetical protein
VMNFIGILMRFASNMQIAFGNVVSFTILILPIHEHGRCFHRPKSLQFLSSVVSSFHCRGLLIPLLSFFPSILMFWDYWKGNCFPKFFLSLFIVGYWFL